MAKFMDLTGKRFGRLVVIKIGKSRIKNRFKWECKCDCGNIKDILPNSLRMGKTISCGCYNREIVSSNKKHGKCKHPLYRVWASMVERCRREKCTAYKNYGGRGITVCKSWEENFIVFFNWSIKNGWNKNLTIDRINNNGNYTPSNCRFVKNSENAKNKRNSKFWIIKGRKFDSLLAAAKHFNVSDATIYRWCEGAVFGKYKYTNKDGCYSIRKYKKNA